ncbi:hypothetical protein [Micromonospora okii]|uniref:hypothetical protein n=1 Tax=Micromonospora okii TaxID=1182970 RepID=UPI001E368D58|nr:hypothetical protein [Micromonospora okii]
MAEKTIVHGSFWYLDRDGLHQTAVRGDTVDITRDEDLKRGERHGAFATDEDLAEGSDFRAFVDRRAAAGTPGVVYVDPADVEARTSPAGSADPRIQSGLIDPATVPGTPGGGATASEGRPPVAASKADWVAYHVDQRPDDIDEATARAEAEAMTKADLVARYNGKQD